MDKDHAASLIQRQIQGMDALAYAHPNPEFTKWRRYTRVVLEKLFGSGSKQMEEFEGVYFLPPYVTNLEPKPWLVEYFESAKPVARAFLESVIDEIHEFWDESTAASTAAASPDQFIRNLCSRFHIVARQLQHRYADRTTLTIDDEHDAQDLFHALLKLEFDDVRAEEWTPSYAGKSARMDFLLKDHKIVIELKKTGKALGQKEVGDQLLVDIGRYSVHPDCKTLICFVYDPEGKIGNPAGIEMDLSGERDGLTVSVIVAPR